MTGVNKELKHDILNCIAILKANAELLYDEKDTKTVAEDMLSSIQELELKIPQIIGY
jgi:hypothetical protein